MLEIYKFSNFLGLVDFLVIFENVSSIRALRHFRIFLSSLVCISSDKEEKRKNSSFLVLLL